MIMRKIRAAVGFARTVWFAAFATGPLNAIAADSPNLLEQRFFVALGTYVVDTSTDVRLDGELDEGTAFDWEQSFGEGDVTRFRLDSQWRFADLHMLRATWFSSSRENSRVLDEDVEWGDETFPASARAQGKFNFDVYELAYEYAFLERDNYEITASIGVHYTELELTLSAEAEASGGTLAADISETGNVGAPLPVIGLRGLWALPRDFWLDLSAQYFALEIDEYDGSLVNLRAIVLWQPSQWLGIGLGYDRFAVDLNVAKDRFDGSLDWTYQGPMIF
jgi:hypothetical protein